jgi:hypothetical protein
VGLLAAAICCRLDRTDRFYRGRLLDARVAVLSEGEDCGVRLDFRIFNGNTGGVAVLAVHFGLCESSPLKIAIRSAFAAVADGH